MIKNFIITILFRLLRIDQSLRKVYEIADIPTLDTPKEEKAMIRLMIDKHKVAMADVADIPEYVKYLKQIILVYQRLRLKSRDSKQKDYLIIILFLTKHIYELEQSLIKYQKMSTQFILNVRKDKLKNQKD